MGAMILGCPMLITVMLVPAPISRLVILSFVRSAIMCHTPCCIMLYRSCLFAPKRSTRSARVAKAQAIKLQMAHAVLAQAIVTQAINKKKPKYTTRQVNDYYTADSFQDLMNISDTNRAKVPYKHIDRREDEFMLCTQDITNVHKCKLSQWNTGAVCSGTGCIPCLMQYLADRHPVADTLQQERVIIGCWHNTLNSGIDHPNGGMTTPGTRESDPRYIVDKDLRTHTIHTEGECLLWTQKMVALLIQLTQDERNLLAENGAVRTDFKKVLSRAAQQGLLANTCTETQFAAKFYSAHLFPGHRHQVGEQPTLTEAAVFTYDYGNSVYTAFLLARCLPHIATSSLKLWRRSGTYSAPNAPNPNQDQLGHIS